MDNFLKEAFIQVGKNLGLDGEMLAIFAAEDNIGGYPQKWPAGTIWEPEGKLYYALTRLLRPDVVVEVGTWVGCSTSHWVSGMDGNNKGILHCFDLTFKDFRVQSPRIQCHEGDALQLSPDLMTKGVIPNILYIDGPKDTKFVRDIIKLWLSVMKSGSIVLVHDIVYEDYYNGKACEDIIQQGFHEAVGDFNIFVTPSTKCGAGYWRKP